MSFVLATVFGIAGILDAFMAAQWAKLVGDAEVETSIGASLTKTRDVLAAAAVSMSVLFWQCSYSFCTCAGTDSCCCFVHELSHDVACVLSDSEVE